MPGEPPLRPGPLSRFLPPLEAGSVGRALRRLGQPGDIILDPFGVSPRLAVEAAQAGRAVLVASNNPVTRFVLEHSLKPFAPSDLRSALARLAEAPKDGTRLEILLLDLYRTDCPNCGATIEAESFVWDRDAQIPVLRDVACPHCHHTGEDPVTEADVQRARAYAPRGLQYALALEEVAPPGDPDREHAEAAVEVYPGRALFALITLINKLKGLSLDPPVDQAAQALVLSACDAANALWTHPAGRHRPRQLTASPRYHEANVWRALERAVEDWTLEDPKLTRMDWPATALPEPGTVAVFPGTSRELAPTIPADSARWVLTVPPRPNQAFWTLSALWAAWLWGRESAAPIRAALRRRRYDWAWHASALATSLAKLTPILSENARMLALMPEAEPGFLGAALEGLDASGYRLAGRALRQAEGLAVLEWVRDPARPRGASASQLRAEMQPAIITTLRERGEPSPYGVVHAAAWSELAVRRRLGAYQPSEEMRAASEINDLLESTLADNSTFTRLGAGAEADIGLYWLTDPSGSSAPLTERAEELVLLILRREGAVTEIEIDEQVCAALPGLQTPDRRFVHICLESYARWDDDDGMWHLRPEDGVEPRAADLREMGELLRTIGAGLGFQVRGEDPIVWSEGLSQPARSFYVRATAAIGDIALRVAEGEATCVLPGGRAPLVAERARRDPRIKIWMQAGTKIIKFRHLRRLAAETTLTNENWRERLAIDPIDESDPQLPLL